MDLSKLPYYALFLLLFIISNSLSVWGSYVTLPFKNLGMWEAYKMAIPFAWLDWVFLTGAIMVGDKYDLVTPTQDTFLLIIVQFSLVLLVNHFYLKQKISRSDIIAFFIVVGGFIVSFLNIVSKLFNIPIPEHRNKSDPDATNATNATNDTDPNNSTKDDKSKDNQ
jgi:hypothetical protein